jgi:hypothetical protein
MAQVRLRSFEAVPMAFVGHIRSPGLRVARRFGHLDRHEVRQIAGQAPVTSGAIG